MSIDDLRPYPLAPAESVSRPQSSDSSTSESAAPSRHRVLIIGLVIALLATLAAAVRFAQDSAQAHRETARLAAELAAVEATARRSAQELDATQLNTPSARSELFGPEMIVASLVIGRVITRNQAEPVPLTAQGLVAEFFGTQLAVSSWLTLTGRSGVRGVLARVDDPGTPTVIWVTRRDLGTVDPAVPLREPCLALNVARLVDSIASGRSGAPVASTAPLRFWPDSYEFVPAAECGP